MIIKLTNSESKIMKLKPRSMDVRKFIAKSDIYKNRTVPLHKGLKEMIIN